MSQGKKVMSEPSLVDLTGVAPRKRKASPSQEGIDLKNMSREDDEEDHDLSEEYAKRGEQIVLHEDKQYYPEAEKIYG